MSVIQAGIEQPAPDTNAKKKNNYQNHPNTVNHLYITCIAIKVFEV